MPTGCKTSMPSLRGKTVKCGEKDPEIIIHRERHFSMDIIKASF
jgi:hypothetical protein